MRRELQQVPPRRPLHQVLEQVLELEPGLERALVPTLLKQVVVSSPAAAFAAGQRASTALRWTG